MRKMLLVESGTTVPVIAGERLFLAQLREGHFSVVVLKRLMQAHAQFPALNCSTAIVVLTDREGQYFEDDFPTGSTFFQEVTGFRACLACSKSRRVE